MRNVTDCFVQIGDDVQESRNPEHIGVHVIWVHHAHGVSCRVMVFEVEGVVRSILDQVVEDRDALVSQIFDICGIGSIFVCSRIENREIFALNFVNDFFPWTLVSYPNELGAS